MKHDLKIFTENIEPEAVNQIYTLIEANATPITVVFQEVAVEKTLDEVKAMFGDISFYYVDVANKTVAFKIVDTDIDIDEYLFDCDYKITYEEDTELVAIQEAITEYNATAESGEQIEQTLDD